MQANDDYDLHGRVIRVEVEMKALADEMRALRSAVADLTALINQARGARYVLAALLAIAASLGGLIAGFWPRHL